MGLGVLNKYSIFACLILNFFVQVSFTYPRSTSAFSKLEGRWNVSEESLSFHKQTFKVRIKKLPNVLVLSDRSRCACYSITNFAGLGNEYKLNVYLNKGYFLMDSIQKINENIVILDVKGKIEAKNISISWNYTIKIKSKKHEFKALFLENL